MVGSVSTPPIVERSIAPAAGSTTVFASCGWIPAVAHTPSVSDAAAEQARDVGRAHPTGIIRCTPAGGAPATHDPRSSGSSGRWQWLSVHRRGESVGSPPPELL